MGFRELWIKAEQPPQFEEFMAFKSSGSSKTSQVSSLYNFLRFAYTIVCSMTDMGRRFGFEVLYAVCG